MNMLLTVLIFIITQGGYNAGYMLDIKEHPIHKESLLWEDGSFSIDAIGETYIGCIPTRICNTHIPVPKDIAHDIEFAVWMFENQPKKWEEYTRYILGGIECALIY